MPKALATSLLTSLRIGKESLLSAVGRRLRRDRYQVSAPHGDVGKRLLQRLQFEIAVGTPDAAIERDDQRTPGEQVARGDLLALGIRQREFRRDVAGLFGALGLAGFDQLRRGAVHAVQHLLGRLAQPLAGYEIGFEGIEAILQGHEKLRWFWLARNIWLISRAKGYTGSSDNIYLEYK
jgi:hypothetical protein